MDIIMNFIIVSSFIIAAMVGIYFIMLIRYNRELITEKSELKEENRKLKHIETLLDNRVNELLAINNEYKDRLQKMGVYFKGYPYKHKS